MGEYSNDDILLIIVALLLPPLAVYMVKKECGGAVCLNILLCFLFGIPGMIHALYVVFQARGGP